MNAEEQIAAIADTLMVSIGDLGAAVRVAWHVLTAEQREHIRGELLALAHDPQIVLTRKEANAADRPHV